MIELGKMQTLKVISKNQLGVFLKAKNSRDKEEVLLPLKNASSDIQIGDEIEVFVYKDAEDRMIASRKRPLITLGEIAVLKVADVTEFGAFMDWGLEKDLLLPVKEQTEKVKVGKSYLVGLFQKSNDRLCATMKVYDLLQTDSPYKENDWVEGIVYRHNKELGAFVAVDNKYHGMILNKELFGSCEVGDIVKTRIKKVRPDGKLELSFRQEAYSQIEVDVCAIMDCLKERGGKIQLNDNSSPEKIKAELNMSKAAFKRAVGRLLKEGAIIMTDKGIQLMW